MSQPLKVIASIKLPVDSRAMGLIVLALANEWLELEMRQAGGFMEFVIEEVDNEHNS